MQVSSIEHNSGTVGYQRNYVIDPALTTSNLQINASHACGLRSFHRCPPDLKFGSRGRAGKQCTAVHLPSSSSAGWMLIRASVDFYQQQTRPAHTRLTPGSHPAHTRLTPAHDWLTTGSHLAHTRLTTGSRPAHTQLTPGSQCTQSS